MLLLLSGTDLVFLADGLVLGAVHLSHLDARVGGVDVSQLLPGGGEVLAVATPVKIQLQEALFNVGLHENLITLAHLSYFPTNKCKATRQKYLK